MHGLDWAFLLDTSTREAKLRGGGGPMIHWRFSRAIAACVGLVAAGGPRAARADCVPLGYVAD